MVKRKKGVDDYLRDRGEKLGVVPSSPATGSTPSTPTVRKVSISPAGKRRAASVGVSSSSRQRTHKRGPSNRKQK